jgi:hypothetical protein
VCKGRPSGTLSCGNNRSLSQLSGRCAVGGSHSRACLRCLHARKKSVELATQSIEFASPLGDNSITLVVFHPLRSLAAA